MGEKFKKEKQKIYDFYNKKKTHFTFQQTDVWELSLKRLRMETSLITQLKGDLEMILS